MGMNAFFASATTMKLGSSVRFTGHQSLVLKRYATGHWPIWLKVWDDFLSFELCLSFVWTGDWWQQSNHGLLSYCSWLQDRWPQHISQQYASCWPCDCRSKIFLVSILYIWIQWHGFTWIMLWMQDYTHTAGATVVHQFCHIGSFAFIGGGSVVYFPLIALISPNSLRKLNGAIMYRFHKMFPSTWWWLEKEQNFAVWIWRDLNEMDLPCQRFILCPNVESFEVRNCVSLWSVTK